MNKHPEGIEKKFIKSKSSQKPTSTVFIELQWDLKITQHSKHKGKIGLRLNNFKYLVLPLPFCFL